jgi:hypothetical protein
MRYDLNAIETSRPLDFGRTIFEFDHRAGGKTAFQPSWLGMRSSLSRSFV